MEVTVRGVADWSWAKFFRFAVILAACVWQCAYGQGKYETPQQTNDKIQQLAALARVRPTDTPIGPGDLLHIDVFDAPELSRDARVGDAGDISYPLIPGKIPVGGLTPFQLESKIEQLLIENGLIPHPQVSVFVKEQKSEPVTVVGAVRNTIVYQVERPTTLLVVLSAAGGISDDAGSVVIVTRPIASGAARTEPASTKSVTEENEQKITIRLQDLLESGDSKYNIPVYGGDVVTVPHAGIVYILGFGVAQPGGYVLQSHGEQVTVLKALALAHGLTSFAKADSAMIMRDNSATGQKDQIPVHIKRIENRKEDDVPMKSNDVLYVPDSRGKKILARGGEAALGIGTGVAIYRAY
jgi:polysaccharide export outer membrane protein